MSVQYWDPLQSTTTDTEFVYNFGSTTANQYHYSSSLLEVRRWLVELPKTWSTEDAKAFVRLINVDTHTGVRVDMLIEGNITITDPNIEVRTISQFLPLLRSYAAYVDRRKIDVFFQEHPINGGE